MRNFTRALLILLFLVVIGYGVYRLWDINNNYAQEQRVRERMNYYKPPTPDTAKLNAEDFDEKAIVNQSVIDAKTINSDIVGWISLDGTGIDYPFVQAPDNDYYLRRDIYGNHAYAGTVFMDYRCSPDFSDFVTVLYGHNMKNGSMFADIRNYADADFFDSNNSGFLYLENATYKLEIFAYLTVRGDDYLYGIRALDDTVRRSFAADIRERAHRYRELEVSEADRLVVLSTCTGASQEQRRVVIAKLGEVT